jgi:hypothetical protein
MAGKPLASTVTRLMTGILNQQLKVEFIVSEDSESGGRFP